MISWRIGIDFSQEDQLAHPADLKLPMLLLHAAADAIVTIVDNRTLAGHASGAAAVDRVPRRRPRDFMAVQPAKIRGGRPRVPPRGLRSARELAGRFAEGLPRCDARAHGSIVGAPGACRGGSQTTSGKIAMTRIADNHDLGLSVGWRRIPAIIAAALSRCTLTVALACFVLPFMTMTGVAGCEGGGDTAPASYSGFQLATFTGPDARALDSGDGSSNVMTKRMLVGLILAPAALLIVAGLVISLRRPQRRFAVLSLVGLCGGTLVLASG